MRLRSCRSRHVLTFPGKRESRMVRRDTLTSTNLNSEIAELLDHAFDLEHRKVVDQLAFMGEDHVVSLLKVPPVGCWRVVECNAVPHHRSSPDFTSAEM